VYLVIVIQFWNRLLLNPDWSNVPHDELVRISCAFPNDGSIHRLHESL